MCVSMCMHARNMYVCAYACACMCVIIGLCVHVPVCVYVGVPVCVCMHACKCKIYFFQLLANTALRFLRQSPSTCWQLHVCRGTTDKGQGHDNA